MLNVIINLLKYKIKTNKMCGCVNESKQIGKEISIYLKCQTHKNNKQITKNKKPTYLLTFLKRKAKNLVEKLYHLCSKFPQPSSTD